MRYIFIIFTLFIIIQAKELTPINLQLAWKYQFQFAGYIMAKEKGYYKEVGLDVSLTEFANDKYALNEVEKGIAQFGIGRSDLILQRLNHNKKFIQLLALCQASPVQLQGVKQSGIKKLEDLKDKKILVYGAGDKPVASIYSMLNSVGINENNMKYISTGTYTLKEITDGTADVLVGYSTISPYHLKKMGYEPISFHPKDYGFDFYGDILFTIEEYADKNPQIVEAFYNTSLKGWQYAFANIDETIDIIKSKYDTQKLPRDLLEFEADEFKKLAFFDGVPFGDINPLKLEKISNTFKLLGETKSNINDFSSFIYNPKSKQNTLNLTYKEKQFIKDNPVLKIGIRKDLKPIDFIDDSGVHKGVAHDLLEIISQYTALRFMHVEVEDENILKSIKDKNIDLAVSIEDKKGDSIIYTNTIFSLKQDLFEEEENKNIKQLNTKTTNISFVLNKDLKILKSIIQKASSKITKEQKEAIQNKWVVKVVKEKFDWTIIYQMISVFAVIIIALLYKNIQQKNSEKKRLSLQVEEKTKDLKISLDEKALLLKELNHRVKNNMQTIISLIQLQNDRVKDKKLNDIFLTIQNRINAMSHLHELLYKQDNIAQIDAEDYFEIVIDDLQSSFSRDDVDINYDIECDLYMEQAIYCGIILNELITNSFKYAFKDRDGEINISLKKEDSTYIFSIKDDGIGYDKSTPTNSLGLTLVKRLVSRQLLGSIDIDSTDGVSTVIRWERNG
jgi:two-component sensor histidine kinase/ABC-type nitrate/sulfonate/bicarbonate transport system substrate-binding protein